MTFLQGNKIFHIAATTLLAAILIPTLVLNGLAGPGSPPFTTSTGDVSDVFYTCFTPAGFTFSIWGIIYFFLTAIVIYAIVAAIVGYGQFKAWDLPGALSPWAMVILIVNLALNMAWLFQWDAKRATASSVILLLIAATNTTALTIALISLRNGAASLKEESKVHFWFHILTLNGLAIYDMWTTLASMINLAVLLIYDAEIDSQSVCIGILSFLLVVMVIWFIVENVFLITLVNPLITHYFVYMFAFIGIHEAQKAGATDAVYGLIVANLASASTMFVLRIAITICRNYRGCIVSSHSSVSITPTQKLN